MKSKENQVLTLFFNKPKKWRFGELLRVAGISRPQLNLWLKEFERMKIIKKIKEKGKMPYYVGDHESPAYKIRKRAFAFDQLTESGLLEYLISKKGIKTVILFGSYARSDWYQQSDIDIFLYGDDDINISKYEKLLKRDIQIHSAKNRKDLHKLSGLIPSLVQGNFFKGSISELGVRVSE